VWWHVSYQVNATLHFVRFPLHILGHPGKSNVAFGKFTTAHTIVGKSCGSDERGNIDEEEGALFNTDRVSFFLVREGK
jgi:hypothetical protein